MHSFRKAITLAVASLAILFGGSAPAIGQDKAAEEFETPEVVDRLFECREIEDGEARLACFDREVGAVYEARESRSLIIAEDEDVREARRGLFGLKLPKIRLFGGGDDDVDTITAVLADARVGGNGLYVFELEDGARWVQTERISGYSRYGKGDTIVISKGAMGSFKAKVNGRRSMRVRRIN